MSYFRSEAGHHKDCSGSYEDCNCKELYERDANLEENDIFDEAYNEMFDPDWGSN